VVEFLDATTVPTPTSTWAMVKDTNGESIIKNAYIYDSQDTLHITNFQPDRCYMLCGYTNKGDGNKTSYGDITDNTGKALLIDINDSDIDRLFKTHVTDPRRIINCNWSTGNTPIRLGYYLSSYIKNKVLVIEFNNNNNYKLLKFNVGNSNSRISHDPLGQEISYTSPPVPNKWDGEWAGCRLGD